jgi:hypothetical protein
MVNYLEDLDEETAKVAKTGSVAGRFISKELKSVRYPICKTCEYFTAGMNFCSVCGCWMPLKTLMPGETCPKSKWE